MERVPFMPKTEPTNEKARRYIPEYIYRDPNDPDVVDIKEDFFGSRRKLRIGILGAGLTCINFLHFLEQSIPAESVEVVVYEKNHDIGGVWLTTRYPGCRNDMPGVAYQFSWHRNAWPEFLPSAPVVCEYIQRVAREHDMYRHMSFQHEVIQASWTDEEGKWTLNVKDLVNGTSFEDKVDVFLELNGPVSSAKITAPGIENFKGQIVHTGHWPETLDLKDETVALLGYGSSGVQVAPNIINDVRHLYTWFRSRTYVLPPLAFDFAGVEGANFKYTDEQKELLRDPDVYTAYCKAIDDMSYRNWAGFLNGTKGDLKTRQFVLNYMKAKLAPKPGLFEHIASKPDTFGVGCRRPTVNHGYLETLVDPKTTVLPEVPQTFTEKGILDAQGVEHELDVVIAATGYDHSHLPRYPKLVNGEDMRTKWQNNTSPPAYMGFILEGMPNYFNPSAAYSHAYGSWHHGAEAMSKYIIKFIDKMQVEDIVSFRPKERAVKHFVRHANSFMQRMVQAGPCSSWYKIKAGRPALFPGNKSHFLKSLEKPRFEDFEFVYENEDDIFSYLGNGFCLDPDGIEEGDVTWYLGKPQKEVPPEMLEKLRGVHAEALPAPNVALKESEGAAAKL